MPLLRKPVLLPVEGVDHSKPSTFINDRAGFPQNMRFYRTEMRKRPGRTKYGSVAISGGQVMGLGRLELNTGTKKLVRTSKTKIEVFNTSTEAWDSISAVDFSGGDDDFFDFANVTEDGLLIVTNYINVIRKWTGAGNTAALGGSPPKARFVSYLSPYTLLGYVDDGAAVSPWTVQWCDTGDPETWTGGNTGALLIADEPSPLRRLLKLDNWTAAYKRDSLAVVRKVSTSDIFKHETIKTGIGLAASRAVVDVKGLHYFMGLTSFYRWNGVQVEDIGGPVRDEVFNSVDRGKIGRCFAVHVSNLSEVWFFIVISGKNWPTQVWKYNYRTGFWYYDTCSELTAAITWERTATQTWDEDTPGSWDEAQDRWDDGITVEAWEEAVLGNSDGDTLNVDYTSLTDAGTLIEAQFVTKDFVADKLEFLKRWLQFDVWAKGPGDLYLYYSTDYGDTWVNIPYSSSQNHLDLEQTYGHYQFYFDVTAQHIRFKMVERTSDGTFYLKNFYPYYLNRGQFKA